MNLLLHLMARRCSFYRYQGVSLDVDNCTATFPLWNLSGQMVGFQQYKPLAPKTGNKPSENKYFTYVTKVNGKAQQAVFGLDLLNVRKPYCFIVEGIFDASPLHRLNENALAVLTSNPKHLKFLSLLPYTLIALCEGDAAGKKLGKYANKVIYLPEGKDPGDMSDDWFIDLVNSL